MTKHKDIFLYLRRLYKNKAGSVQLMLWMRVLRGRWRQAATTEATMKSCCMERLAAQSVEEELTARRMEQRGAAGARAVDGDGEGAVQLGEQEVRGGAQGGGRWHLQLRSRAHAAFDDAAASTGRAGGAAAHRR
jgi:hypothetical protein